MGSFVIFNTYACRGKAGQGKSHKRELAFRAESSAAITLPQGRNRWDHTALSGELPQPPGMFLCKVGVFRVQGSPPGLHLKGMMNVFSHQMYFHTISALNLSFIRKAFFLSFLHFFFLVLRGMWHSKVALEEKKKQNQNWINTQWNEARREGSEMATCLSWLWLLCHMGMKSNSRDTLWGLSKEQFARKNTPYNSKNCTIRSLGQLAAGIFLHIAQGTLIRVRTQD